MLWSGNSFFFQTKNPGNGDTLFFGFLARGGQSECGVDGVLADGLHRQVALLARLVADGRQDARRRWHRVRRAAVGAAATCSQQAATTHLVINLSRSVLSRIPICFPFPKISKVSILVACGLNIPCKTRQHQG